jgi:hypothetical protein
MGVTSRRSSGTQAQLYQRRRSETYVEVQQHWSATFVKKSLWTLCKLGGFFWFELIFIFSLISETS